MMAWTFRVYRVAAAALAPVMRRRLAAKVANDAELLNRKHERDGDVPAAEGELWLHAASMGEVAAAVPLIDALLKRDNQCRFVVSTLTDTGARQVLAYFSDQPRVRHVFAPLDTRRRVCRWLESTRPAGLLLIETEIWPELLHQCALRRLPVALVSARLSTVAWGRYRRFQRLFQVALASVDLVLCQDELSRDRFERLGVPSTNLQVTGNLKQARLTPTEALLTELESSQMSTRETWLAGSVHPAEAELLAKAHCELCKRRPGALMVLVPRHLPRAEDIIAAVRRTGLTVGGDDEASSDNPDVLIVRRAGVLAGLYCHVGIALVGGSLVPGVGGHNLLEPAAAGCAVISGLHLDNQRESAALLEDHQALTVVSDAMHLTKVLEQFFEAPAVVRDQAGRAREAASSGGLVVLERTLNELAYWPGLCKI